ncbi:hypothetical protein GCM10027160_38110 [Streptomyces calidiresistens]|uniref:GNAT family N-acetyltransferase n=1 Tax=Streptomyces calidiresistens TaxID=1485586 RepID=A0A7W3XY96_9ACTN|nr:GNAT family N-acetyltransferase [Streptomyces calidiresistens]MBB0231713.1 GNAT family N-acetyltransferase [Streptomyces calidiresistens]
MTTTTAEPRVSATWYDDVDQAPPDTLEALHPSRTRAWAGAWQHVRTEQVLAHRHVHLHDPDRGIGETVSFHLVPGRGSPYWSRLETDAGSPPVWPGPVLYAGSPHAEYGGAGTATAALAAATTTAGLHLAQSLGARAVVHPGLTPGQAAALTAAAPAGVTALDLGTDVAFTRPLGADAERWWAGIPQKYRSDARRTWRRGTDAGLTLAPYTGAVTLPHLPYFTELANSTADRHGTRLYGPEMFEHLTDVPGAVLLAARDGDRLVGGFYGWLHRRCLYLWACGIDYRHPAAHRVYKWLLAESALWAIDRGAHTLDLGRANYAAKLRVGCRPQPLRTVVFLPRPEPATVTALSDLARRLGEQALPHLPPGTPW